MLYLNFKKKNVILIDFQSIVSLFWNPPAQLPMTMEKHALLSFDKTQ